MNNQPLMYDEETYDRVCAERDAALVKAERLLAALRRIANFDPSPHGSYSPSGQIALHAKAVARAAIAEHEAAQKGAGG